MTHIQSFVPRVSDKETAIGVSSHSFIHYGNGILGSKSWDPKTPKVTGLLGQLSYQPCQTLRLGCEGK
jgi:hypothetical protein